MRSGEDQRDDDSDNQAANGKFGAPTCGCLLVSAHEMILRMTKFVSKRRQSTSSGRPTRAEDMVNSRERSSQRTPVSRRRTKASALSKLRPASASAHPVFCANVHSGEVTDISSDYRRPV